MGCQKMALFVASFFYAFSGRLFVISYGAYRAKNLCLLMAPSLLFACAIEIKNNLQYLFVKLIRMCELCNINLK